MARLPKFDAGRTFVMTGLSGTYQDVGAVMGSPVLGFIIYNTSDVDAQVSFDDGVNDGPIVPSMGTFDSSRFSQSGREETGEAVLAKGAQIQVKQVTGAGTSGNLIINIVRS